MRAGQRPGELVVKAKFAVAYAFDSKHPERLRDPLDIVTVRRFESEYLVYSGPDWTAATHGVHLGDLRSFSFSINTCTV